MAKLYFFYSSMNAGKSTHLLQSNYNIKKKTMLFIPQVASEKNEIISRIGIKKRAIIIKEDINIFKFIKNQKKKPKYIFVDEVQFLKKKQIFELIAITDILKINVLTYGLRTDFKSNLFEGSKILLGIADKLIEIKTICKCGKKATMNAKISKKKKKILHGSQIDIEKKKYISLCRYHYYKTNKL